MSDQQLNEEHVITTCFFPPTNTPWGDNLHPITISQLIQALSFEENPLMKEKDVVAVKLVAHVISAEVNLSVAEVSYTLEDGTGKIYAFETLTHCGLTLHHELPAEAREKEYTRCKALEHTFAEVTALLKKNSKWKKIKIASIHPVHDYYQVMHHIMNVIQNDMRSQQSIQPDVPDENSGPREDSAVDTPTVDGLVNPDDINVQPGSPTPCPITIPCSIPSTSSHPILPNTFSPQKHQPYATLKPLERAIMKYTHRSHVVLVEDLAQAMQDTYGCTESQFNQAIQVLLSEAYITSPLDDGYVIVTPKH